MKIMRYLLLGVATAAGTVLWSGSDRVQAQQTNFTWNSGSHGSVGHGHPIHRDFGRGYFPKEGPFGSGQYGHFDRWRTTPHWHYYPSGIYLKDNQYQYVPGHYQWHQGGKQNH